MKKINELISSLTKNPKYLVIIGIIGILLIALSTYIKPSNTEKTVEATTRISAENYKQQLEEQVKSAVGLVTNGKVQVIITLESDIEYIYASEEKEQSKEEEGGSKEKNIKDSESENSYVIVKDESGNELPLIVTAVMPRVKGAVVNCEGASDPVLNNTVKNIVMTALNVSEDKVYIADYILG